jgi:hypothetical protein
MVADLDCQARERLWFFVRRRTRSDRQIHAYRIVVASFRQSQGTNFPKQAAKQGKNPIGQWKQL